MKQPKAIDGIPTGATNTDRELQPSDLIRHAQLQLRTAITRIGEVRRRASGDARVRTEDLFLLVSTHDGLCMPPDIEVTGDNFFVGWMPRDRYVKALRERGVEAPIIEAIERVAPCGHDTIVASTSTHGEVFCPVCELKLSPDDRAS